MPEININQTVWTIMQAAGIFSITGSEYIGALAEVLPGASGVTFTDGTHIVTNASQLTVSGGTVGGSTPDGTLAISGGGSGTVNAGTTGQVAYYAGNGTAVSGEGLSTLIDGLGNTQGDVLYRSAAGWAVLAPGTSGQVLQTGGAGANPSWATAGGGSNAPVSSRTATTSPVTVGSGDLNGIIFLNLSAPGTVNINPAVLTANKQIVLKDISGHAGSNPITVQPSSGTIDGAGSFVLGVNYGSAVVINNGANGLSVI